MRIIAGNLKGRKLTAPMDRSIRPTSDKVKEALFSIAAAWIPDGVVVDLFSGTGNLGLEAISRGAQRVYFGDRSKDSIALTKKNIEYCKAQGKSVVYQGEYDRVLSRISQQADVIFLDPPYRDGLLLSCIRRIEELDLLAEHGIIVAEHSAKEALPEQTAHLTKWKEKRYGSIGVTIYQKAEQESNQSDEG